MLSAPLLGQWASRGAYSPIQSIRIHGATVLRVSQHSANPIPFPVNFSLRSLPGITPSAHSHGLLCPQRTFNVPKLEMEPPFLPGHPNHLKSNRLKVPNQRQKNKTILACVTPAARTSLLPFPSLKDIHWWPLFKHLLSVFACSESTKKYGERKNS